LKYEGKKKAGHYCRAENYLEKIPDTPGRNQVTANLKGAEYSKSFKYPASRESGKTSDHGALMHLVLVHHGKRRECILKKHRGQRQQIVGQKEQKVNISGSRSDPRKEKKAGDKTQEGGHSTNFWKETGIVLNNKEKKNALRKGDSQTTKKKGKGGGGTPNGTLTVKEGITHESAATSQAVGNGNAPRRSKPSWD